MFSVQNRSIGHMVHVTVYKKNVCMTA